MKHLVLGVGLAAVLTGCGGKSGGGNGSPGWSTTNLAKDLAPMTKQREECGRTMTSDEFAWFSIRQFIDGVKKFQTITFGEQVQGNYIESPNDKPIDRTTYNSNLSIKMKATWNGEKQEYELKEEADFDFNYITYAERLDVCPNETSYKSFTHESAGLSISEGITKTYKAVTEVSDIKLEPISLKVTPKKFIDYKFVGGGPNDRKRITGYEADNAFYDPSEKAITFLPQSLEYQEKAGDVPFWEVPMVAPHEYGHHIFQTLVYDKLKTEEEDKEEELHSKSCFENHTTLKNQKNVVGGDEERDHGATFAVRSMNEGFSDLISYYVLGDEERKLTGVKCFEKNREVGSPVFGSYASKRFTAQAVSEINDPKTIEADQDCDTPNYQGIHQVGAMFAHNAHNLISSTTSDKKKKLAIILKWASKLAQVSDEDEREDVKAAEILFNALELVYKTALEEQGVTVTAANCSAMKPIFNGSNPYKCRFLVDQN